MADSQANQFYGMSSLRAKEKEKQPKSEQALAMEKYLQRYANGGSTGDQPKVKRRKKVSTAPSNVRIVDEDVSGFTTAPPKRKLPPKFNVQEAELSGDDSDGPVIANPGEAELYKRQQAKERSGAAFANWAAADDPVQARRPRHDSPDASPPRRRGRHDSPDASPPRRAKPRHDSPDASPPRRQPRHHSPDASPPRRKVRHDSPDASPPRRAKARHDSPDASPPRRKVRHDSPDASPPRRAKARHDSPDASPPRRKVRHDSPNASPPRRAKARHDSPDASPPRRQARQHSSPDASPPRRKARQDSPDASPPRRPQGEHAGPSNGSGAGPSGKMADGTRAGMISAKDLAHEISLKRKADKDRFVKMEEKTGSRFAQTVYRDKETGRVLTKEDFEEKERQAAEKKRPKYETPEWGGGLRQKQERAEQQAEMQRQAAKPFARNLDDVDEDLNLRDRARFGDPMAHLVKKREEAPLPPAVPAHMAKLLKKGGFAIPQEVPPHSWLRRNMGAPANRYGIKPGRHWDGVDRSTGFERDMFKMMASRAAQEREARAWAQADM